ncbi:hypothetical protein DPMN_036828 [Dreissena polymorpha]|uniref:Uncharacterized protein n=1 Tax=Dreissena polymorpha TaxID=45954 RepID=A0A9D4MA50_DREPO|nr:hypothetical protein DPMN_036828 [Dreissena polymorpha]
MGLLIIMLAMSSAIWRESRETGRVMEYLLSSGMMGITELESCTHSGQEYSPLDTSRLAWAP